MRRFLLIASLLFVAFLTACTNNSEGTTTSLFENSGFTTSMADYIGELRNPYNIALFATEDLTTSVGINFELPSNTNGYVEYAEAASNQFERIKARKKIRTFDTKEAYLFEYTIEGLTPDTTYQYRVCNEDNSQVSQLHTFTTLGNSQEEYTIMYLSDPQDSAETGYMTYAFNVRSVMDYANKEYQLVMASGDIVNNSDSRTQWNMFLKYSSLYSFSTPLASAFGNHDMGGINNEKINSLEFDGYMNLPNNGPTYSEFTELANDSRRSSFDLGKTYSFDYGYAHITVIDTEIYYDGTTTSTDYDSYNAEILNEWVREDLNNSDAIWKIVMLHRGPYSSSYNSSNVRSNLVPIFEDCGVDLVLSGHDHQYSRAVYWQSEIQGFEHADEFPYGTFSLFEGGPGRNFNNYSSTVGITYLTPNTSSNKFYGSTKDSSIEVNFKMMNEYPVIPYITITENQIQVVSYLVEKDSGLTIAPNGVTILEEFIITQ